MLGIHGLSDLLGHGILVEQLPVEHLALQGQGQFRDAGSLHKIGFHKCQAEVLYLVRIAPALCPAIGSDLLHIYITKGNIQCEIAGCIEHLPCEAPFPYVDHHHGHGPHGAQSTPANGHAIDLVAVFCGYKDTSGDGSGDLVGVVGDNDFSFHCFSPMISWN